MNQPNGPQTLAAPLRVSDDLHTRLVDLVEEEQGGEPPGRRKAVLAAMAGAAILTAGVLAVWTRFDALAAARPTLSYMTPAPDARDIPADGFVSLTFARKPSARPTLTWQPADGVMESSSWDGKTFDIRYRGLRLATRYSLILAADYRSRFQDVGHFEQRWSFTTEGYPVLQQVTPVSGATMVLRSGQLSIEFNHRPTVEPKISFVPDAAIADTAWSGRTWIVRYRGLAPLTSYRATVTVDFGVTGANIDHSWSFVTEPGAPPPGVPVIWYATDRPSGIPPEPVRLAALDWQGEVVGTMYPAGAILQSPDGAIVVEPSGIYLDRSGAPLGRSASPYPAVLADDGRSVCQLGEANGVGPLWIFAGPVGGSLRMVVPAGQFGARSGLGIIACSVLTDRVVVDYSEMAGTSAVKIFALSSGRTVYQRSYSLQTPVGILSSRDGRYLAELTTSYDTQAQRTIGDTVIRRTSDGAVVAHLANQRVVQFSWDGSRVLTASLPGPTDGNEVDLVDWQSGRVLWRQSPAAGIKDGPVYAMAEPNGSKMMVALGTRPNVGDLDQLWLLQTDGTASQLLDRVFYALFASAIF